MKELQSLGLDVNIMDENDKEIILRDPEDIEPSEVETSSDEDALKNISITEESN